MNKASRILALKAEIEACSDILEKDGLVTMGSRGQVVAHPLIAARHAAMSILHKLELGEQEKNQDDPLEAFLNESLPGFE